MIWWFYYILEFHLIFIYVAFFIGNDAQDLITKIYVKILIDTRDKSQMFKYSLQNF